MKKLIIIVFLFLSFNLGWSQELFQAEEFYKKANYYLSPTESKIYEAYVTPNWLDHGNAFWYEKKGVRNTEYWYVNPLKKVRSQIATLEELRKAHYEFKKMNIDEASFNVSGIIFYPETNELSYHIDNKEYIYNSRTKKTELAGTAEAPDPTEIVSPDGQKLAYLKDYNLYYEDIATGESHQLTFDGAQHYAYATDTESHLSYVTMQRYGITPPPVLQWSPDSKKILTFQLDERQVPDSYLLQMVDTDETLRPKLYTYKYPVPSDSIIPVVKPVVIDLIKKKINRIDVPPMTALLSPLIPTGEKIHWLSNTEISILWEERFRKEIRYYKVDASDGSSELLISEKDDEYIAPSALLGMSNVRHLNSGEFIWYSQRSGYGHLYLYSKDKKLKNAITLGNYLVHSVLWVDENERQVYFLGSGEEGKCDPYKRLVYRVDLSGDNLTVLTPNNADNKARCSPNQKYMIVNEAWDGLPTSVIRDTDGKLLMELEESDFSSWIEKGWQLPERVKFRAADGVTETFGVLFLPSTDMKNQKLPIIDDVYPGPQSNRVQYIGLSDIPILDAIRETVAMANLGFAVLQIDGRGTPLRSKRFSEYAYNDLGGTGGIEDHIAGIRQLASRYQSIDTTQVGIFGHSGGGFASTRAILLYPNFYDVAVSSSGNHNSNGYLSVWMDSYMSNGDTPERSQNNQELVNNLKGKLLLITGDMDENVHPTMTYNLIDALIKANKNFDFILIPNSNHYDIRSNPYFIRQRWDYFYKHLLDKVPPKDFGLKTQ